jgi:heptosyltransferase-2
MNQQPVLEGNQILTRLYVSRKSTEKAKRIPESSLEIRANKYDLLIDAYSKLESWLVVLLSGAKRSISYKKRTHFSIY